MDPLLKIIDSRDVLIDAVPVVHPDLPEMHAGVLLRFDHADVWVSVNPDDDSLRLSPEAPPDLREVTPAAPDKRFAGAVSKPIQCAWAMTNHQGYRDGLQIEFCNPDSVDERAVVQFVGKASMLEISVVTPGDLRIRAAE